MADCTEAAGAATGRSSRSSSGSGSSFGGRSVDGDAGVRAGVGRWEWGHADQPRHWRCWVDPCHGNNYAMLPRRSNSCRPGHSRCGEGTAAAATAAAARAQRRWVVGARGVPDLVLSPGFRAAMMRSWAEEVRRLWGRCRPRSECRSEHVHSHLSAYTPGETEAGMALSACPAPDERRWSPALASSPCTAVAEGLGAVLPSARMHGRGSPWALLQPTDRRL